MSFMQQDVYYGQYYEVSANHGETHIVPVIGAGIVKTYGELADYVEGRIDNPDDTAVVLDGWLARMSAPGYMDCTDWSAHETETEARAYLDEYYGDDSEDDASDDSEDE